MHNIYQENKLTKIEITVSVLQPQSLIPKRILKARILQE